MYVDKTLAGVQAVQTLSRLNRSHPKKRDTFVLDFMNDADAIKAAFDPFYRTTMLSGETDPNKLHDMQAALKGAEVFTPKDVDAVVASFLAGETRTRIIDPVLDRCCTQYDAMGEDEQVAFKGNSKASCAPTTSSAPSHPTRTANGSGCRSSSPIFTSS